MWCRGIRKTAVVVAAFVVTLAVAHSAVAAPVIQDTDPVDRFDASSDTTELLAHRYETASGVLSIAASTATSTFSTQTLFDFDRDGLPDAMVRFIPLSGNDLRWQQIDFDHEVPGPAFSPLGDGRYCYRLNLSGGQPNGIVRRDATTTLDTSVAGRRIASIAPEFPEWGTLPAYAPAIATISDTFNSATENRPGDYLPSGVGGATRATSQCDFGTGVVVDFRQATDRGTAGLTPVVQAFEDRVGDGTPDLRGARIEQWTAISATGDVVRNISPSTAEHRPTDLVISLPAVGSETITYIALPQEGPSGFVRTSAGDAGRVRVRIASELRAIAAPPGQATCLPTSDTADVGGQPWVVKGVDTFQLPVAPGADGGRTIRIALDQALGMALGTTERGRSDDFTWTTIGFSATPDYAVDWTGVTRTGTRLGACAGGVEYDSDKALRFAPASAVHQFPIAALSASSQNPLRGQEVTLDASSSTTPGASGDPTFHFDLQGDGSFASSSNDPVRQAAYQGPTRPRVVVESSTGTVAEAGIEITPQNNPPVATISAVPDLGVYKLSDGSVAVDLSGADSSDPDGTITGYEWKVTTPEDDELATGSEPTLRVTFTRSGDYTARLTVTDDDGDTSTATRTLRVRRPPVALITGTDPTTVIAGREVTINALGPGETSGQVSQGDDLPLTFRWKLDDSGEGHDVSTGSTPSVTTTFPTRGTQEIGLLVTDASGSVNATTQEIQVRGLDETPPTAVLEARTGEDPVPPAEPRSGADDVLLDASESRLNAPDGSSVPATSFIFDPGDGSAPVTTSNPTLTHRYAGSGPVEARVTVRDERLDPPSDTVATLRFTVAQGPTDVNAPRPMIARTAPSAGLPVLATRPVTFSAAGTEVRDGPATYRWDLNGDGDFETDTGEQDSVTTAYPGPGRRSVRVRVTDGRKRVADSEAISVEVGAAPTLAPELTLRAPEALRLDESGRATAELDATGSRGRNPDPTLRFRWDLDGDGTYETDTGTTPRASAVFTGRGVRTVRVRATDVYGNTGELVREIFVRGAVDAACGDDGLLRELAYGPVRATACWRRVDRPNAGPLWIATGTVNLSGLVIRGAEGSTKVTRSFHDCDLNTCRLAQQAFNDAASASAIAFDPYDGKIVSNSPVALAAVGSGVNLPLSLSPLEITLPFADRGDGFLVRVPSGSRLFGFPLTGEAEVRFPAPGVTRVRVAVAMPSAVGSVTSETDMVSTTADGLTLDRLRIEFDGGLLKNRLPIGAGAFEYRRAEDLWRGSATVTVPAPRPFQLTAAVAIERGDFKSIFAAADALNQPIGKGIFLQGVRLGVGVDPLDVAGGVTLSAGPIIPAVKRSLLFADGDLRLSFPGAGSPYHVLNIGGKLTLLNVLPLSNAGMTIASNGFVEVRGGVGGDYGPGYFEAGVRGWVYDNSANLDGNAEGGVRVDGRRVALVGAHAVLSTRGVGVCGTIPVINLGGGFGFRWGSAPKPFEGCDLGPYREARPADIPTSATQPRAARVASAQARAPEVRVPAGAESVALRVRGRHTAPDVRLVDRRGRVAIETPRNGGETLNRRSMVVRDQNDRTTSILWKNPPAGRYTIVGLTSRDAVRSAETALGVGEQRVTARMGRRGDRRTIRWSVSPPLLPGQRLVFGEVSPQGGRDVVRTAQSRGSGVFRPRSTGAIHTVQARILSDEMPAGRPRTVARFRAPVLRPPARPRGLVAERRGRDVHIRWREGRGQGAAQWRLAIRVGTQRERIIDVTGARRSMRLREVPAAQPVRVSVRGIRAAGVLGRSAVTGLRRGAARSGPTRPTDAAARRIRVSRDGRALVVRWAAGSEQVTGWTVRVSSANGQVVLPVHPGRTQLRIPRPPSGALRVRVTAERSGTKSVTRSIRVQAAGRR